MGVVNKAHFCYPEQSDLSLNPLASTMPTQLSLCTVGPKSTSTINERSVCPLLDFFYIQQISWIGKLGYFKFCTLCSFVHNSTGVARKLKQV